MSLDSKIPNVIWPEKNGKYKIVQFLINSQPYIRFGEDSHVSIVKEFANEVGLEVTMKVSDYAITVFQQEKHKIIGAGWCELKREQGLAKRIAEFYGKSKAYVIGINEDYLGSIREFHPDIDIRYNPHREELNTISTF